VYCRHIEMEVHEKREKTMRKIKKHMNMMMIALIGKGLWQRFSKEVF
jgi:hypothetical protein